ncbi:MAG TPA: phage integrase N-terminal SAM-like domain-containing protein [bacterium]
MDQTTLAAIVTEYAAHLQAEKGLAPVTQEGYLTAVKAFLGRAMADPAALLLSPDWDFPALDKRALELHLNALRDRQGWKPESIAQQASALHSFFRYLQERHYIPHDPGRSLRPRLPEGPPPPPEGDEAAVLRMLQGPGDTLESARLLALVELLYGAGLRPAQAYGVSALELDERDHSITATLPDGPLQATVSVDGFERLLGYLTARRAIVGNDGGAPFWVDRRSRACTPGRLARQIKQAMEAEGLDGGPAALRQLAARHFAERGGDLRSLQRLLRTKRLGQLDRFQPDAPFRDLVAQFRKAHPREGEE